MRKKALQVLVVSVSLSALMGIIALLSGNFGETEGKILLSTLSIAAASILAMACAAAVERERGALFAPIGIGTSLLGLALMLIGIWGEMGEDAFWKSVGTVSIAAAFCAHACLLRLVPLAERFAWAPWATIACTALLGALLTGMMWAEEFEEDNLWRAVGVLSILGSTGTILVPVYRWMSRDELREGESDGVEVGPPCPHCGERLPLSIREDFPA